MRNLTFCRRALLCAIAAVLAVAAPTAAVHAAPVPAATLLSKQLPAGVSLGSASVSQLTGAVRAAVAKNPERAAAILTAALQSKAKNERMTCGDVRKLLDAAISSDKDDANKLTETAQADRPDCSDALESELTNRGPGEGLTSNGPTGTESAQGFDSGLGAGFPGAPGFVGSAPSGTFAFPPVVTPAVTNTTNG